MSNTALIAELEAGDGTYYIAQEMAMAPGIAGEWPTVIPHPKTKNGRLVKRQWAKPETSASVDSVNDGELLDDDGYPTDFALNKIKAWHYDDLRGFFAFIRSIWAYENCGGFAVDYTKYDLSTCGWSGNESIIAAFKSNSNLCWTLCWVSSKRGGHYEFEIPVNLIKTEQPA